MRPFGPTRTGPVMDAGVEGIGPHVADDAAARLGVGNGREQRDGGRSRQRNEESACSFQHLDDPLLGQVPAWRLFERSIQQFCNES
jgi:hypothetical protein